MKRAILGMFCVAALTAGSALADESGGGHGSGSGGVTGGGLGSGAGGFVGGGPRTNDTGQAGSSSGRGDDGGQHGSGAGGFVGGGSSMAEYRFVDRGMTVHVLVLTAEDGSAITYAITE